MAIMISSRQIKAARALLGWTQTDLARASGLHLNAVNKIENGQGDARASTMERIKNACESGGLRFRGQRGVELKEDIFETSRFEGPDFLRRMMDDILTFLRAPEDELLVCSIDEQLFDLADSMQMKRYYKQMVERGFSERVITNKHCQAFFNKNKDVYRWLPEKVLGKVSYIVYGNRVAFIQFQPQEVLFIRNKSLATTFRGQFENMWAQAKPFP
jgi:transcriptional regulator with XRE-family HTH domain